MSSESYFNHPTFGLLVRVCDIEDQQELFTTLYAQRLFFLASTQGPQFQLEPVNRVDAKLLVENRLRQVRRLGTSQDYTHLQTIHRRTFL